MEVNLAINKAIEYFDEGYNCAESVLLAFTDYFNIKDDNIPKIATMFGGGISRNGLICGALSGAVISIGLRNGRLTPDDDKLKGYDKTGVIIDSFYERFGSINCKDLIGVSLQDPEGLEKYHNENIHSKKCVQYVEFVITLLINFYR